MDSFGRQPHEPTSSAIGWPGTSPQPAKPRPPEALSGFCNDPTPRHWTGTRYEQRAAPQSIELLQITYLRMQTRDQRSKGSIWTDLQAVGRSSSGSGILNYHILQAFTYRAVYTGDKVELIPKEAFESSELHVGWKILTLTTDSLFYTASTW